MIKWGALSTIVPHGRRAEGGKVGHVAATSLSPPYFWYPLNYGTSTPSITLKLPLFTRENL